MPPRGPSTCRRVIFCQPLRDESQIGTAWIFLLEWVGSIFVSASSRARLEVLVTGGGHIWGHSTSNALCRSGELC